MGLLHGAWCSKGDIAFRLYRKSVEECGQIVQNGAGRPQMANVMGIWGGLVGPKSGNVEKVLVFKIIFEGVKEATGTPKKVCS